MYIKDVDLRNKDMPLVLSVPRSLLCLCTSSVHKRCGFKEQRHHAIGDFCSLKCSVSVHVVYKDTFKLHTNLSLKLQEANS